MSEFLRTIVVKYGGSARSEAGHDSEQRFAQDVAAAVGQGIACAVVHGGGKDLSTWMNRLGLVPRFVQGLRFTDEATLEIAEMVLSAKMNKSLAALITEAGVPALGLSGRDGKLLVAEKICSPDGTPLGLVGEVHSVNHNLISTLLAGGIVPVLSPIASDGGSGALNCNADHIASILAQSLRSELLILLTDVDAIAIQGHPIRQLSLDEAKKLLKHPEIQGGMLPKLGYGIQAVEGGVQKVIICNAHADSPLSRCLAGEALGTCIVP